MERIVLVAGNGILFRVEVATTRRERVRGLLPYERLASGHALLIPNARAVHTVGMAFSIDVAFLDQEMRVIALRAMRPGRIGRPRLRARYVLECNAGEGPAVGDRLVPVAAVRRSPRARSCR